MIDFIPLENGESINRKKFIDSVKEYSAKAVHLLPVGGMIKQKILQEIGIQPYDAGKINTIYKIGRQRISPQNRNRSNVYGECQPILKNGKLSFTIAMENNAPKKLFMYFLCHEIDHMVGYLGYRFSMKEMGYSQQQRMEGLSDDVRSMKTEFFARINTANEAMLGAEDRDFVFGV
ncbi:hypothetical protein [Chryseobacterium limigenitum]|uniref:Uncharacterized protein n=1 Tax=Chryseobacterium limigenitum TaxID=1612149 RepID=A0A1K2IU38_9FLAO|nr:hypothetical protein [Chryseobacterium limigenitum]SFZ95251.1 hypothetical protein SAMN05216324_10920 [Chryseobacterium limigenitum]